MVASPIVIFGWILMTIAQEDYLYIMFIGRTITGIKTYSI